MAQQVGSLKQYGYEPERYTSALINARRRFTDKMTQNVEKIGQGISSEVSSAVEQKKAEEKKAKQDASLRAQANDLYQSAQTAMSIVSEDPGAMGERAKQMYSSQQTPIPKVPGTDATTEELQSYLKKAEPAVSKFVYNLAGSNELAPETLTKLTQWSSEAGLEIDFTKPIQAASGRKQQEAVSGAVTSAMQPQPEAVAGPVRPTEVPVEGPVAPGGTAPTRRMQPEQLTRTAPAATTQSGIAKAAVSAWPEDRPPLTSEQLKTDPRYVTAPTDAELASQQYRTKKEERLTSRASLQNENLELQWFKAKLQERGMDLRTQGEINDILVDKVSRYEREKRQAQDELKEIQNPKPDALGITPPVDYDALEEKTNQIERITQLIVEARNLAKVTASVSKAPGLSSMSQDPGPGPGRPSSSTTSVQQKNSLGLDLSDLR